MVLAPHQGKTMRGSLFPLFSGPILSSCQDMDHQNRGNRDPLIHGFGISPLGEIGEIETLSWFPAASSPTMVTTVGTFAYKQHPVLISMFWWHISSTSLSYHNFLYLLT